MADINISQGQSVPQDMHTKYVDEGDGTHALRVDVGTVTVTGGLTDAQIRATPLPVSGPATNAELRLTSLDVELTASEAHIGQVGGEGHTASQTPTITVGAYSAGDAVGGLLTFANVGRVAGLGGVLTNVLIIDDAGIDAQLELWLFDRTFTAMADNDAWAPSAADLENWIGTICTVESSAGWLAAGTPSVIDIEVTRRLDLIGTSLFGQLVTRTTPTYTAVDNLTVKVPLLQD